MNALFRWLDVDRVQWSALLRAALRTDFAMLQAAHAMQQKRASTSILFALLIYSVAGISPAIVAAVAGDVLLSATVLVCVVGFMVLSSLLVGEGTTILSASDFQMLGFRPVTSRTYLAVRVSSLLVRTGIIATCVALAPLGVLLLKGGFHPWRGVGVLAAAYASALAVTFAIVAMYGWLLRLAGPLRMARYASYMQFTAQMVTWGGFVLVTQELVKRQLAGMTFAGSAWAVAFPAAWFGSYVAIADGIVNRSTVGAAALSLLLIAALWRLISGKLSLGYADTLGRISSAAVPAAVSGRPGGRWLRLLDDESRAMAILVRSHMQHDIKFRLGVISLIPITLMYIMMGGWPADPFVPAGERGGDDAPVIQMALLFLPVTLRRVLVTSERYRASWIFLASPADHAKLVLSSRNIITIFFLVPYLLFVALLFLYSFGDAGHALLHAAFTGMVSYLVLQFMVMMNPQLPFSMPAEKDAQSASMIGIMIAVVVVGLMLYALLTRVVYRSPSAMIAATVVFLLVAWVMDRHTRRRVAGRPGALVPVE